MNNKIKFFIKKKKIAFFFLFISLLFCACGPNDDNHLSNRSHIGTYKANLVFPQEIPRIDPDGSSRTKLINGGIDCTKTGIATLTFSFFSAGDNQIAGGSWPCEKHQAVITDIPAGSGIKLEVTAENEGGIALLRGEEREIIIRTNQTTEGDDITLYPADSPSVTPSEEPRTLVFNWEHIRFPGSVDHYRLQVDPDGNSGFSTVEDAEFIDDTNYELTVPVHLTDWGRALYRVAALDATDKVVATSSAIDLLTTVAAEEVIGYFKANNTESYDVFGENVTLSGDGNLLAIGARLEDSATSGINGNQNDNSAEDAGAVYVFSRKKDGIWRQEAYLKASNSDAGDEFGSKIMLSNDGSTLAVGAWSEASASIGINGDQNDNSAPGAGAVYLFVRSNSGEWRQQAYIKSSNTEADDIFGVSLALSANGNTLAIGASEEDSAARGLHGDQNDNSAEDAGAVYIFNRNPVGVWHQEVYIKAGNTDSEDYFGINVALSADGNTLAIGANGEDSQAAGIGGDESDNSLDDSGAVYVFSHNSNGVWRQEAYIKASNPNYYTYYGGFNALSGDGNTLVVGNTWENSAATGINGDQNDTSAIHSGAVYVFTRNSNAEWRQQAYIKAENAEEEDWFGWSPSLSSNGNILAVGAPFEDSSATGINNDPKDNSTTDAGAVYLFTHDNSGNWRQQAYIKASNTERDDSFGNSAISADGQTLAIGAEFEDSIATGINGDQDDNSADDTGAVYLY
jgi:hypothetical protein